MGVHGLWTILDPIREHVPIRALGGKRIAIDLSGWICGDMQMNQRVQTVSKLYIRNMIFRIIALLRESILPVSVTDGVAPSLKAAAMTKRKGYKDASISKAGLASLQRTHFSRISAHCCRLLTAMGVPCVASPGEAEAMCAFLNEAGLVNGCVTNDGDSFLYGASVVYRNFSLNSRDASVTAYDAKRLSTDLGICRKGLVLLGLVLGCDYWPSGVAKVGRVSVATLLPQLDMTLAFDRLTGTEISDDINCPALKTPVWHRIEEALAECPVGEILNEFLQPCSVRGWSLPQMDAIVWLRPQVNRLVNLCISCLDWRPGYSLAQFVPLLALWITRQRTESLILDGDAFLEETYPIRIIRKRSVNFLPCFEVEWKRLSTDIWSKEILSTTTIENPHVSLNKFFTDEGYRISIAASEFKAAFPHMSLAYESLGLKSISAKLDALLIDVEGKSNKNENKPRALKPKKESQQAKQKVTMDAFVVIDTKKAMAKPVKKDDYLPNWDSSPETTPKQMTNIPSGLPTSNGSIEWEPFSPSPGREVEDARLKYISVRLNTAFERRRLTLNSSLLSITCTPSLTPLVHPTTSETPPPTRHDEDEFSLFKTPIRLIDRLS